jgi:MoxR-like ATPase
VLAMAVSVRTKRVQFTPDLLPADIIGSSIFFRERNEFVFMPGPIFTSVLLADEINRTTPRTQSAL